MSHAAHNDKLTILSFQVVNVFVGSICGHLSLVVAITEIFSGCDSTSGFSVVCYNYVTIRYRALRSIMKLRWKSTLILILGSAFLLLGSYLLTRNILLITSEKIEKQLLRQESVRVTNLLQQELSNLSGTTADWALWDETYEFVTGTDPGYISRNFMGESFGLLNIDYVMIFNRDNQMQSAFKYDMEIHTIAPMPVGYKRDFVEKYLELFTNRQDPTTAINQMIVNQGQVALVSSYGITDSSTNARSEGTLIYIRIIDAGAAANFESVLDSKLSIQAVADYIPPATPMSVNNRVTGSEDYAYEVFDQTISSTTSLLDINGASAATLTIVKDRVLSRQVKEILNFFILQLVALTGLVALLNVRLLTKYVIIPIEHIGHFLGKVNLEELSSLRLSEDRALVAGFNSEIGTLVAKTDLMLDRIDSDARKLGVTEKRIKQALEASKSGIWEYHIATETVIVDDYVYQMLGSNFSERVLPVTTLHSYVHPEDLKQLLLSVEQLTQESAESINVECRIKAGFGKYHWYLFTGDIIEKGPDHKISVISGLITNIDRQKQLENELRFLSYHDKLTGLHNRRYFEKMLIELDEPKFLPLTVMIGDINGLKLTNDTFGHPAGDLLLTAAAKILRKACRRSDVICRWGGDEFAMILPNSDEIIAERIYDKIKQDSSTEKAGPISLNMAVGYAVRSTGRESLSMLVKTAEERMYRNKITESESARSSILTTIQKTLNDKSIETYAHSQRLAELGTAIARRMGLGPNTIDEIVLLANLHDIGKIAIPEAILNKPGKLSEAEWEIIRNHPEIGYRIASTLQDFAHIALGIMSHHERMDGTGYPKGLTGDQIPLIARIIAVADSVDVMQHGRPYQASISIADVIAELHRCSGTQFDPEIVLIAAEILEEKSRHPINSAILMPVTP